MAAFLALGAAMCWGVADFVGGLEARRLPALLVALASQLGGAVLLVLLVLGTERAPPDPALVLLALAVGLVNAVAFFSLYSALAIGEMARVAPVLGTASIVPILVGLAGGDKPSLAQLVGCASAVGGVVLVSTHGLAEDPEQRTTSTKATFWALLAAVCMGITLVGIRRVSDYDPFWAVLLVRTSGVVVFAAFALFTASEWPPFASLPFPRLLAIGVFDVAANSLWAVASTLGLLSLVAVLGALFPAVTVLLAVVILRERLRLPQVIGAVMVLLGVVLISAG